MTKHRITDSDAAALLRGEKSVRADFAPLADSLAQFRAAAFETAPRPSAELLALLDVTGTSNAVASAISSFDATQAAVPTPVGAISRRKRLTKMFSWFAGLGVLAKIALASGVAFAAVTGAGAAGVLPDGSQDAFDSLVSAVVPGEEDPSEDPTPEPTSTDDSTHPDNFGGVVSGLAHDKEKGPGFGQIISGLAHEKNAPGTSDDGDDAGDDEGEEGTDDSTDSGTTHKHGKPDHAGGHK